MADAAQILAQLRALPVVVDRTEVRVFDVPVSPYEGGARPSSTVRLFGGGEAGEGECVAWTRADHEAFAHRVEGFGYSGPLGEAGVSGTPYERCALEGALIDLGMRQARLSWADVTGAAAGPLKTWVSFDRCADPAARAVRIDPSARFKIDVDPGWDDATLARLAALDVGVLDFKYAPDPVLCERARGWFPEAIFEDPPVVNGPTARDQGVLEPADAHVASGEQVNLKGPRMGGWLALLEAAAICEASRTPVYCGGMFELGVGREQARLLALALAPHAWHDLAHIPRHEDGPRPEVMADPMRGGFR